LDPSLLQLEGGWDPVSLLCNAAWERHPRGLIAPCRGAHPSLVLGRFLLGNLCRGLNCGLLCRLLADSLLGGIDISNCRLGCPQAGSVARINIRGCTNKEELMQITILTSNLVKNKESAETLFRTYRSELRCAAVKNHLLVYLAAAAASVPPGRIGSMCAARGSLITRSASIGAMSGRLRGLQTKDVAVSSSSLSSLTILTSRRRLGHGWSSLGPSKGPQPFPLELLPWRMAPQPSAFSQLLCHLWSTLDNSGPRRYWCIGDTKQHCLLVGLPQQDGPYQVPATHTLCTGQYLLSTIQR
jgi:hypothetical protein